MRKRIKQTLGYARYLSPTVSMRNTYTLLKKDIIQHKHTFGEIRSLWQLIKAQRNMPKGMTLEYAIKQFGEQKVYRHYLFQKRCALAAFLAFTLLGSNAVLQGNIFGLLTILAGGGVFYALALSAQYRLWQMEENDHYASLSHLTNGRPSRWLQVMNPQLTLGSEQA